MQRPRTIRFEKPLTKCRVAVSAKSCSLKTAEDVHKIATIPEKRSLRNGSMIRPPERGHRDPGLR